MRLILAFIVLPLPALAHPHVFVETRIEVIFDAQNHATGLRIAWTYDDLFSLMIIEDRGLDPDYDAILTDMATAELAGFDMQWEAGFPGDTYAKLGDTSLPLSQPTAYTAGFAEGKITSTHLRTFDRPIALGDDVLSVQVYDPGFYTSYAIVGDPLLTNATACTVKVSDPDRGAADALYLQAVAAMAGSADIEAAFPAIGAAYAQQVQVTCTGP